MSLIKLIQSSPRTQKARGIMSLVKCTNWDLGTENACRVPVGKEIFLLNRHTKLVLTAQARAVYLTQLMESYGVYGQQWMARPCPVTPRHGFVESRCVKTVGDLQQVLDETLAADPHGEVILMPFIAAAYSGIVTNNSVSVGSRHNGATAGLDAIAVPCESDLGAWLIRRESFPMKSGRNGIGYINRMRYAGIAPHRNRHPYFELVNGTIVQVRYGPAIHGTTTNYNPTGEIVQYVYAIWEPSQPQMADFLRFEEELAIQKAKSILPVLYLPTATLSCHAAVQAICAGLPVVTGPIRPVIGEQFQFGPRPFKSYKGSPKAPIEDSLIKALALPLATYGTLERKQTILWAAAVIQGMATSPMTPQFMRYVVTAGTILLRFGMAACFGEHRHWETKGPLAHGQNPIAPVTTGLTIPHKYAFVHTSRSRTLIHTNSLRTKLLTPNQLYVNLARITTTKHDFAKGEWRTSYGGPKWAECTAALEEMMLAWMRLHFRCRLSHEGKSVYEQVAYATMIRQLMAACNRFITLSHNGGKCLTKFVHTQELDAVSIAPGLYLVHPLTRSMYYDPSTPELFGTVEAPALPSDPVSDEELYTELTGSTPSDEFGPTGMLPFNEHDLFGPWIKASPVSTLS